MRRLFKQIISYDIVKLGLLAFFINFIIECCSRRSIFEGLKYLGGRPLVFIYNALLIMLTLTIALLCKRRAFALTVISTVWIGFGVVNGIVLSNRVTPFTAVDFTMIKSGLELAKTYMSMWQLVLIFIGFAALIVSYIAVFVYVPKLKGKVKYKRALITIFSVAIILSVYTKTCLSSNLLSGYFGNIADAYLEYGFPYSFTNTLINTGIDKPSDYSEEKVAAVFDNIDPLASTTADQVDKPNIIFLQLESFFDATYVKHLTLSEDPIPNFRSLKENYTSGFLSVPSVGAGTANTEFEVMSGMNLEFFGPGEYPYKTILKETTSESTAYDLKQLGYNTTAMHNYQGNFYGRSNIFKNLGFDTYVPMEYMNIPETTELGWPKDFVLTQEILDVLNSSEGQDYLYTISVQGHGDYPEYQLLEDAPIKVEGAVSEAEKNSFEYYLKQIHEMDMFIKELTDTLSKYDEKVVLVMYGDHLPSLGIEDEDLVNGDVFQTEYIVWSNFPMEKQHTNMEAYQLSAYVLGRLGMNNGVLTKYHQSFQSTVDYEENLKLLQYDMLYGNQYVFNGVNPYASTELVLGIDKISINVVYSTAEGTYVKGENFNQSSVVSINDKLLDTTVIDQQTLYVEGHFLEDGDIVLVNQKGKRDKVLGTTEEYVFYDESSNVNATSSR